MKIGITMLIHNKDDIEFVTEFPCFLGHPVQTEYSQNFIKRTGRWRNIGQHFFTRKEINL